MRPISLIPLPGKILEHLISTRLKAFIQHHDTLTNCQHGFRKSHSTITAISKLIHNIYSGVDNKVDTYLVYLDLKEAFDTVSHKILLNKLGGIGLDQKTLYWFTSYLENRQQYMKIKNYKSTTKPGVKIIFLQ